MTANAPQRRNDQRRVDPRRNDKRRRPRGNQPSSADIWRTPGALPDLPPIEAADDPAALVRSLGEPPLPGGTDVSPYVQSAVERSAGIAAALALSVGLLASDPFGDPAR